MGPCLIICNGLQSTKTIDAFLPTLQISQNGIVSVWDSKGLMISSSLPNISWTSAGVRYNASASPNPWVAQVSGYILNQWGEVNLVPDNSSFQIDDATIGSLLVNVRWLNDGYGINWLTVLIIPRSDFFALEDESRIQSIVILVVLTTFSAIFSILLSWGLARPLRKLSDTMVRATQFDFSGLKDGYLEERSIFSELAGMQMVFREMLVRFAEAIKNNKALISLQRPSQNSSQGM